MTESEAIVAAAAIGVLGAIAGAALQGILSRGQRDSDRAADDARLMRARLIDFDTALMDGARSDLIALVDWLLAGGSLQMPRVVAASARFLDKPASDKLAAAVSVMVERMRSVEAGRPVPRASWDEKGALQEARVAVLSAFEAQMRRVIAGDRPLELTGADLQESGWSDIGRGVTDFLTGATQPSAPAHHEPDPNDVT